MMGGLGITEIEKQFLEKYGYTFSDEKAGGQTIWHVIVVVHDARNKHDSGYPFLRVFGALADKEKNMTLVDMGWHDHYCSDLPTNTDALAKNIWRVGPWGKEREWKIRDGFSSYSSLSLHNNGVWD